VPKLYTKRGDKGETGLLYGGRVQKTDIRVEAYGTVDEAVSVLGLARALCADPRVKEVVLEVQRVLFTVAAELATLPSHYNTFKKHFQPVEGTLTSNVEQIIDELARETELPPMFVIPGASAGSAALDVARTVLRRAERIAVQLQEKGALVNDENLRYLNRVSDLLFLLARYEDRGIDIDRLTGQRS